MYMFSSTRCLVVSRVVFLVSTLLLVACMHMLYSETSRKVLQYADVPEPPIFETSEGVFDEDSGAQFSPERNETDRRCVKTFMQSYKNYCEASTVDVETDDPSHIPLCACISRFLVGRYRKVDFKELRFSQLEARHLEVSFGGHWSPEPECRARQRIALIVPCRNRTSHLKILLGAIHPMLQNQLLEYTVFVVEQEGDGVFNKGYIMNAAFTEILRQYPGKFDCFIFHDVDMLPEDDRNIYTCADQPRHIGVYIDKYKYNLLYPRLFGGVTGFTKRQFELCNGYSLKYYGWGGEDDDLLWRIESVNMTNLRFPKCVNAYKMIPHGADSGNPINPRRKSANFRKPAEEYQAEGLNNLQYELKRTTKWPLYTHFLVAIPPLNDNEAWSFTATTTTTTQEPTTNS